MVDFPASRYRSDASYFGKRRDASNKQCDTRTKKETENMRREKKERAKIHSLFPSFCGESLAPTGDDPWQLPRRMMDPIDAGASGSGSSSALSHWPELEVAS